MVHANFAAIALGHSSCGERLFVQQLDAGPQPKRPSDESARHCRGISPDMCDELALDSLDDARERERQASRAHLADCRANPATLANQPAAFATDSNTRCLSASRARSGVRYQIDSKFGHASFLVRLNGLKSRDTFTSTAWDCKS